MGPPGRPQRRDPQAWECRGWWPRQGVHPPTPGKQAASGLDFRSPASGALSLELLFRAVRIHCFIAGLESNVPGQRITRVALHYPEFT